MLTASQIVSDMNTPVGGTPPPDTFPPTVFAISPASGASSTNPAANVTVTFSEPMSAASISSATIELRDSANQLVAASVTYDAPTLTATLNPANDLSLVTTYTVMVRGGTTDPRVKDTAGNALAANFAWSFTTWPTTQRRTRAVRFSSSPARATRSAATTARSCAPKGSTCSR